MKISANHLKRYKEIGLLLWKYGRSDLVQQMGIDEAVGPQEAKPASSGAATPDQLTDDLEAMGPTYVKLGQVLSGRADHGSVTPDAGSNQLSHIRFPQSGDALRSSRGGGWAPAGHQYFCASPERPEEMNKL